MALPTFSRLVVTLSVITLTIAAFVRAVQVPAPPVGAEPGPAVAAVSRTSASLSNTAVAASWLIANDRLKPELFENRPAGQRVRGVPEVFRLVRRHVLRVTEMLGTYERSSDGRKHGGRGRRR